MYKTIAEQSRALAGGKISSVELTQSYLDRIKKLDGELNSFITVTDELALEQAKAADERRSAGNAEALTGIPLAHKDLFCTEGVKTSVAPGFWTTLLPLTNLPLPPGSKQLVPLCWVKPTWTSSPWVLPTRTAIMVQ